jgi:hypothetical protein
MSKIFDYYNQQNNEEPCCVPVMETGRCACGQLDPNDEPTDSELEEIEWEIDNLGIEDLIDED